MSDRELVAGWDTDRRLAATAAFVAGLVTVAGAAVWFGGGMAIAGNVGEGQHADAFAVTLIAGVLLLTDVALLVFVVGLAYAFTAGRSFGLIVTTAVASLATAVSAALHLLWGYVVATPEVALPAGVVSFVTWLALNLWLLPLFGLLVGTTLLALWLALRVSEVRFARRLGRASAVIGGVLCVLTPFTGFEPGQMALLAVAAILVASGGIGGLLLVALVRLGMLLWGTRRRSQRTPLGQSRQDG